MTEELKTVVTIISVIIIVGIFGHGLWSIRKNKEQLRDLKQPRRSEPGLDVKGLDSDGSGAKGSDAIDEPLDADGLDSHGVGVPRTIGGSDTSQSNTDVEINTSAPEPQQGADSATTQEDAMPSFSASDPLDNSDTCAPEQSVASGSSKPESPKSEPQKNEQPVEPSEVLIIHVAMPDGQTISGASLLPLLISLGFKFGEMDIFHRHEDSAGHGSVLFSLASMYNPGTFDIDNIEQISTKGLSMFMTLPCKGEALANFNMMHNAAKKISEEFGAQLLDSNRSALTVQTVRHYVEKIREFERQRLIKG